MLRGSRSGWRFRFRRGRGGRIRGIGCIGGLLWPLGSSSIKIKTKLGKIWTERDGRRAKGGVDFGKLYLPVVLV